MVDKKMFAFVLAALYKVKETSNREKWPDIKILLSGDFFQLSPTSSSFLFKEPSQRSSELVKLGYKKYRQITNVIYLKESHRFNKDQEWGKLLNKARLGEWTNEMRNILSKRYQAGIKSNIEHDNSLCKFIPTVSPENTKRQQVNYACIKKLTKKLTVYKLPAIIQGANERQLAELLTLSDDKTSRIPAVLHFYIGMPIKFRSNQCVPAMLANGTCGTIFHVQWKEGTTFITDGDYKIPSKPPLNMYINITGPNVPPIKYPNLPNNWPISVLPIHRETRKINYFKNDKNDISINNYPIIPAFGVTAHLVQGLTLPKVIITDPLPKYQKPDRHALYMTISRCPTREGVFLAHELTDRHYNYFIPNEETLREDNRLLSLDEKLFISYNDVISVSKQYEAKFSEVFISTCESKKDDNSLSSLPLSLEIPDSSDDEETLITHYAPISLAKENQSSKLQKQQRSLQIKDYFGFINNNNTCWLSATLQSLASVNCIDTWLSQNINENIIITQLRHIINQLKETKQTLPEPLILKKALSYTYPEYSNKNSQEDAMELITRIISIIGDGPFHFDMEETAICNACGFKKTILIPATHIKKVGEIMKETTNVRHSKCQACSSFTNEDQPHTEITKVETYPNLLLINLARFNNDLQKIHTAFEFSHIEKINKHTYKLRSLICHLGTTAHTGHFICISRKNNNEQFVVYNDNNVSYCNDLSSYATQVYILLYEKQ